MLPGQRADGLPLLVAHAVDHELGEAAVVVRDAERRVLGVEQFAGGGDDRFEDVSYFEVLTMASSAALTAARADGGR